jgi:putative transposase
MPWNETAPMNEKIKFISAYLGKEECFRELCNRFKISCKTGYKYLKRYKEEGIDGLKERSRVPHRLANQLSRDIEDSILEIKAHYPSWGSKKIRHKLLEECHDICPARSTIDELLKRHHLVRPAKRKRRVIPYKTPLILCTKPNDVWSIDYKGQFQLGNQKLCYPLTITDNFSRYLFAVDGANRISGEQSKEVLKDLFIKFGLPLTMRSDNGSPFAGNGLGGLSTLAVWLIKLGIIPERIRKGHPEENGRHERMHLTLKQETTSPVGYDLEQQQLAFDRFQKIYNEERPHEGIAFQRPCQLYTPSERIFPKKLNTIEYDTNVMLKTRRIRSNGTMKWAGKELFISETLIGETIGMKPYSEDEWLIHFSLLPIGLFNEKTLQVSKI